MVLKRKRSSFSFSSPPSHSDTSSSTSETSAQSFFYQQSKPTDSLYTSPTRSFLTYDNGHSTQHLNSRTRKRHRDDRPDEETVFCMSSSLDAVMQMRTLPDVLFYVASTISRLYEAQRRHPDVAPVLFAQPAHVAQVHPQRSTLHAFWHINQAPSTAVPMEFDSMNSPSVGVESRCEDCDRTLGHEDAMKLDGNLLQQETACRMCKRQVCDFCAVQGNERVCLSCASGR